MAERIPPIGRDHGGSLTCWRKGLHSLHCCRRRGDGSFAPPCAFRKHCPAPPRPACGLVNDRWKSTSGCWKRGSQPLGGGGPPDERCSGRRTRAIDPELSSTMQIRLTKSRHKAPAPASGGSRCNPVGLQEGASVKGRSDLRDSRGRLVKLVVHDWFSVGCATRRFNLGTAALPQLQGARSFATRPARRRADADGAPLETVERRLPRRV